MHFGGTHARGQNCLQPEFAKSDEHFRRRDQTLHSACVAVIRSGNERAVKMAKNSWLIKRDASISFGILTCWQRFGRLGFPSLFYV